MFDSLTGVPLAPQEQSVRPSRCPKRELVQSQDLTTSVHDPLFCPTGESEGSDGELGEISEADVIGDGADGDNDLTLVGGRRRDLFGNGGEGYRRPIDFGHEESLQNDLVKVCVRAAGQETVQLQDNLACVLTVYRRPACLDEE